MIDHSELSIESSDEPNIFLFYFLDGVTYLAAFFSLFSFLVTSYSLSDEIS